LNRDNWDAKTVFVDGAYQAAETWYSGDGSVFHPALHYFVGGNSKVYGAALFRLRERDFGEVRHKDGIFSRSAIGSNTVINASHVATDPTDYVVTDIFGATDHPF
jgi:hypothetical protein